MFCLDLQLEVSNLTLNGIPIGKDSKDVTVFQHKTGKSFGQGEGVDLDGGSNASFFSCIVGKKSDQPSLEQIFHFVLGGVSCGPRMFERWITLSTQLIA